MIKLILKIIRYIIIFFLFFFFLIKLMIFITEEINDIHYSNIAGYSYYKVEEKDEVLNINEKDYLIIGKNDNLKKNDLIVYLSNSKLFIYKIDEVQEDNYICINSSDTINLNKNDSNIKGKIIYNNKSLNDLLNILVHPLSILIMIILVVVLQKYTFKRYE